PSPPPSPTLFPYTTLFRSPHGTPPVGSGSVSGFVRPVGAVDLAGPGQVRGVDDRVRVALLGEEALPVRRVLAVEGVAADHRVEVDRKSTRLNSSHVAISYA